ncbi:aminotransferase class I/II-fold pyridoxal phosphate-dependent enzyme [Streptomyces rhizosphaericus]|uniref:aminotransferase class I/II-fold pyridoxal phosphate-dependent enzyme n=1 Tax=Streptomyces rhizosphaericus TaxID=114699 RepID=UPI000A3670B5|nr:aminotransferase class I/II-fold pyridoxal phosphate-dependent enzyme [Streptomyces rhizosphaericus]
MLDSSPRTRRDPASVQGGDLTDFPPGTLNLSICSNRLGPPDSAVDALRAFLADHSDELVLPPYETNRPPYKAEKRYLSAYADHLGVGMDDLLPGRGVTEFLMILSHLLRGEEVALITPEYTGTMSMFHYAHFLEPSGPRDTTEQRLDRVRNAMRHHSYVILSNPNNPLGHYIPRECLLMTCEENPNSLLIVDEEYIEFQGPGLSLAGADLPKRNLAVLQSSGKAFGITATRAGVMWTRSTALRRAVQALVPSWPLSLLDTTLATAALQDKAWLHRALTSVKRDARQLEHLLTERFGGDVVSDSDIHFRFTYLHDPYRVFDHMKDHGIAVRIFDGHQRGRPSGMRIMAPRDQEEFTQLRTALQTLS